MGPVIEMAHPPTLLASQALLCLPLGGHCYSLGWVHLDTFLLVPVIFAHCALIFFDAALVPSLFCLGLSSFAWCHRLQRRWVDLHSTVPRRHYIDEYGDFAADLGKSARLRLVYLLAIRTMTKNGAKMACRIVVCYMLLHALTDDTSMHMHKDNCIFLHGYARGQTMEACGKEVVFRLVFFRFVLRTNYEPN